MDFKIVSQVEQPLLKRKHIVAQLSFPGAKTPSNKETIAVIAKHSGATEDVVAVRRIGMSFGSTTATVDAYVYENKQLLEKTESRPKPKVAAAAPGAPAEAKKGGK